MQFTFMITCNRISTIHKLLILQQTAELGALYAMQCPLSTGEMKIPTDIELPTFSIENMLLACKVEIHLCTERAPTLQSVSSHTQSELRLFYSDVYCAEINSS